MVATKVSLTGSEESAVGSTVSGWSDTLSVRCVFDDAITGSMCPLLQPPAWGACGFAKDPTAKLPLLQ